MRILFYNYRNGDFHIVRTFIRDIIEKLREKDLSNTYAYYSCLPLIGQNDIPHILCDIPYLEKIETYKGRGIGQIPSPYYIDQNEIFINTHINALSSIISFDKCVYNTLYENFQLVFNKLGIEMEDRLFYLPEIDFTHFKLDDINSFLQERSNEKRILMANSHPVSGHSGQFDFEPIINACAQAYKDIDFYITNKFEPIIQRDNVFYIGDIVGREDNTLNEIAYVSTYCNIIIGKMSGPYNFAVIKENLMNLNKTFISLSDSKEVAIWLPERTSKIYWTSNYNYNAILKIIKRVIWEWFGKTE